MPPQSVPGAKSPRIVLVRLSAIGDVIHGLPVACALRDKFPQAWIAWVVEQRAADLLRGHEALDELIVLPHGWLRSPAAVWGLRRRLRAARFDIAIDAQGLSKSAIAAWLSGAQRRLGFDGATGREMSRWLNNELVETTGPHMVDRGLQLLRPLGIESPAVRFGIAEGPAERQAAERIIRCAALEGGFGVIGPGAGWPSKLWPVERFAAVAGYLGRAHALPTLVIWGNAKERAWAEQIAADSGGHARAAPGMTLLELAAVMRRARLFVGSDSGPLHLAVAVGAPCVGLYGPFPAEKHGPYGPQHIALQAATFEGTTRQRRLAPPELMLAISVEMVCGACERILCPRTRLEVP